ncbi:coiled-coiled domain protein [Faustovirus]|nr:coiled-coiled domain protein [Faustovirus]
MNALPSEILTVIIEALDNGDIMQLGRDVNTVAGVSRGLLAATKVAKWKLRTLYVDKYISSHGVSIVAEYRYLNRFALWRLVEIGGTPIKCTYTDYSNSIARLESNDINFVCYTPNHGMAYFDLLRTILMLTARCRWGALHNNDQYTHEILNKGKPTTDYGAESGVVILEYLTNIINELTVEDQKIQKRLDERRQEDGRFGPMDDEEDEQEKTLIGMLDTMSEFFRVILIRYARYIHSGTRDTAFIETLRALFDTFTRPRKELPIVLSGDEDHLHINYIDNINHQLCTFLDTFNLSFKFECKIYIKQQTDYPALPGVYFYQFEKLADGHHLSRITNLE